MQLSKSKPRVLLGFGDIAQRLASISLAGDIPVTGVRRSAGITEGINFIAGDIRDPEVLDLALDQAACDIVVTLTPDNYSEQGYRDSYLACAQALARLVADQSSRYRIIFVSSTSVYGQNSGEWVNETSLCDPASSTAKVLLESEAVIAEAGIPYCNLRFSGIYGPGRTRIIERTKSGNIPPQHPIHWTNRIHADDCASVIDYLLKLDGKHLPGFVLASDPLPAPRHEVQHFIAEALGISISSDTEPNKNNDATGKRCSSSLLQSLGFKFRYPDFRSGFSALIQSEHQGK